MLYLSQIAAVLFILFGSLYVLVGIAMTIYQMIVNEEDWETLFVLLWPVYVFNTWRLRVHVERQKRKWDNNGR